MSELYLGPWQASIKSFFSKKINGVSLKQFSQKKVTIDIWRGP